MSHMRKMWDRAHVIDVWERERKHVARTMRRQGLMTTREFDAERADIETQAANARSDMFRDFLLSK